MFEVYFIDQLPSMCYIEHFCEGDVEEFFILPIAECKVIIKKLGDDMFRLKPIFKMEVIIYMWDVVVHCIP